MFKRWRLDGLPAILVASRLSGSVPNTCDLESYGTFAPGNTASQTRRNVRRVFSIALIGIGASIYVFAGAPTPEIDPGSGASALTLLAGAILLIRHKTSKR
jgi:hypothetical protein